MAGLRIKVNTRSAFAGLKRANKTLGRQFSIGLRKAALVLKAESVRITPVDTGNLRNSAYTNFRKTGFDTTALVAYAANYSIFVHEITTSRHAAGTSAKFLEKTYKRMINDGTLVRIVAKEMGA